jgi:hypothetical protein
LADAAELREDDHVPLNRVRLTMSGVGGLPGLATFHFGSAVTDMTALRTFWDSVKSNFPNTFVLSIPNSGDTINEDTGQIQGAWSGPTQANVVGTGGTGSYLATAGPMIRWTTPQVVNGRRPIGKTYLVPAMTTQFSSAGTIQSAVATSLTTAAQALVVAYAGEMKTYHRPVAGHGGVGCTITAGQCTGKQTVLRSRRD